MGLVFTKLKSGEIVSSNGGLVFRILSTDAVLPPALEGIRLALNSLNLPAGTYTINVSALAPGLAESPYSNSEIYTVE